MTVEQIVSNSTNRLLIVNHHCEIGKVYTQEELTRRLDLLAAVCELLAERLTAVDGQFLDAIVTTIGDRLVNSPPIN